MPTLTADQSRILVARLIYIDSLLGDIERTAAGDASPWARKIQDIPPDDAALLHTALTDVRDRMTTLLRTLGIAAPLADISARWSIEVTFQAVDIALSELTGTDLKAYGALDEETAAVINALSNDLRRSVGQSRAILHAHDSDGLSSLLSHLDGTVGTVLRTLDELSRTHRLTTLLPLLHGAAERALDTDLTVGIFGRTSVGKSSFINALLGEPVLPIGVLPVTAVPLRVSRGSPRIAIHFADHHTETVMRSDLPLYATEEANPNNRRGVRAIDITMPEVPEGVRLVDTPGVGATGLHGSSFAFSWLARCDLALVLVAAGAAISRDDVALVSGLHHAGIRWLILLNKIDLLATTDIDASRAYVKSELARALALEVETIDVQLMSVTATSHALVDRFRDDILLSLSATAQDRHHEALIIRLRRLIHIAASMLKGVGPTNQHETTAVASARLAAATALQQICGAIDRNVGPLASEIAEALNLAWHDRTDAAPAVRERMLQYAGGPIGEIRAVVECFARETAASIETGVPPMFDPAILDSLDNLHKRPLHLLGTSNKHAQRIAKEVVAQLGPELKAYGMRLLEWGTRALEKAIANVGEGSFTSAPELPPELARLDEMLLADQTPPTSRGTKAD